MQRLLFTYLAHFTKIALAIFIFAIAFSPSQTFAAAEGGEYSCQWAGNSCEVLFSSVSCKAGYDAQDEICNSIETSTACNAAVNLACKSLGCASGKFASGIAGQCQCVGDDYSGVTYPSMEACNNLCPSSRYGIGAGGQCSCAAADFKGTTYSTLEACNAAKPEGSVCESPKIRMCSNKTVIGAPVCGCFTPGSCGGLKQPGCNRYWCEEGLQGIKPTQETEDNTVYCVHNQQEADEAANAVALTERPAFNLCLQSNAPTECFTCATRGGVWTAIGCVPTTRKDIVSIFLTLAISISGGIVILRVLQAGFMLSTSQGEQNKVQEARDILTSSITGLLFIIFSMVLLNTIGVNILRIPGF